MPYSSNEGKEWTLEKIKEIAPKCIVDVGPGYGNYSIFIRGHFGQTVKLIGVEVWAPYVEAFELKKRYDQIIISDIRYLNPEALKGADVIIFGDILEHMPKEDAQKLIHETYKFIPHKFISIPIIHYPQDAVEGNPFEEHVKDDWSHQEMLDSFEGITDFWTGQEIGVYYFGPAGSANSTRGKAKGASSHKKWIAAGVAVCLGLGILLALTQ